MVVCQVFGSVLGFYVSVNPLVYVSTYKDYGFHEVELLIFNVEEDKQMKKRMTPLINSLVFIILMGAFLAACGSSNSTGSSSDSAGQTLMQARCSVCHSVNRVESAHHTAAEWKVTVERMINKGAQLTPQEEQTLISYLARNYK